MTTKKAVKKTTKKAAKKTAKKTAKKKDPLTTVHLREISHQIKLLRTELNNLRLYLNEDHRDLVESVKQHMSFNEKIIEKQVVQKLNNLENLNETQLKHLCMMLPFVCGKPVPASGKIDKTEDPEAFKILVESAVLSAIKKTN